MAAFDNGLALGADGLELDVRLSRDGRVVVHHDRTLDRTTALTGPIGRRSADELNEAAVPLLSDVLGPVRLRLSAAATMRTPPVWRFRCGPWILKPTRAACSSGASTD